ncbi:MAG: hypothetical protein KC506_03220, partial [Nanoarchaeota archaeon]|nr:hypothetical protein [Nanoarchaeota archaeon]
MKLNRAKKSLPFLLSSVALLFQPSCSEYKASKIETQNKFSQNLSRNYYALGVEPLDTEGESKSFLVEDVGRKGYLPFIVSIENKSAEKDIVFYGAGQATFTDSAGHQWKNYSPERMSHSVREHTGLDTKIAEKLGGVIPAIIVGRHHEKWNKAMTADYKSKSFSASQVVKSGSKNVGILIFRQPEEKSIYSEEIMNEIFNGELNIKVYIPGIGVE